MQRARRLASVVAVASLAVAGLSACRAEPSVAAYVGQSKLTESRVDAVWDEARDKLEATVAQQKPGEAVTMPISRADVVRTLLGAQVLKSVAEQRKLTLPANLTLDEYAKSIRLPADTEYVRLFAENDAYVRVLREGVKDAPPATDADLREVFEVLADDGQVGDGDFANFKTSLPPQNQQLVQTAAEVRHQIGEISGDMNIKVNPKYQPAAIPVLQFQTRDGEVRPLISAPLGADETAPVSDIR